MQRVYKQGAVLAAEIAETAVPAGTVALWFLGQAGIAVKGGDSVLFIDPYFSDSPSRIYPSPLRPDDVRCADWLLCTHNHLDHLDAATIGPLVRRFPDCRVVVPAPHVAAAVAAGVSPQRVLGARADEPIRDAAITITPLRASHEEFEQDADGDHSYLGYVIELDGIRIFHSGDTVGFPEQAQELAALRPHVAFLPINGRDWLRHRRNIAGNMNYREALDLAVEAGVDLVAPIHYDLFAGNAENPAFFVDHLYRTYPAQKFKLFAVGERILYMPAT